MNTIQVKYIGRKTGYKDHIYGTGLTFDQGQVRALPPEIAGKFLRHLDAFTDKVEPQAVESDDTGVAAVLANAQQGELQEPPKDDTAAQLAQAQKQQDEITQQGEIRAELLLQVSTMAKDELITLAQDRWGQVIAKNTGLENVRHKVVTFIDQFGAA